MFYHTNICKVDLLYYLFIFKRINKIYFHKHIQTSNMFVDKKNDINGYETHPDKRWPFTLTPSGDHRAGESSLDITHKESGNSETPCDNILFIYFFF